MSSTRRPTKCTVIVPAARADSIPNCLQLHPNGHLLLVDVLRHLDLTNVSRVVLALQKTHVESELGNRVAEFAQFIQDDIKATQKGQTGAEFEVCTVDTVTASAVDTVEYVIRKGNITGPILIKDSDGVFDHTVEAGNYVVALKLSSTNTRTTHDLLSKSFLSVSGTLLSGIHEKQMISNVVSVGGYAFEDVKLFLQGALKVRAAANRAELCLLGIEAPMPRPYVSHVVQLLMTEDNAFAVNFARTFVDFKSHASFLNFHRSYHNISIVLEGTLLVEREGPGILMDRLLFATARLQPVDMNIRYLRELYKQGRVRITISTRRASSQQDAVKAVLKEFDIPYHVLQCDHLVSNTTVVSSSDGVMLPYPTSTAVTLPHGAPLLASFLRLD